MLGAALLRAAACPDETHRPRPARDARHRPAGAIIVGGGDKANETFATTLEGGGAPDADAGSLDANVPPDKTHPVAQAPVKAHASFDALIVRNVHHGYAEASNHLMPRWWDYVGWYLLGADPPKDDQVAVPEAQAYGAAVRQGRRCPWLGSAWPQPILAVYRHVARPQSITDHLVLTPCAGTGCAGRWQARYWRKAANPAG
jgi:hypothetical protein